jgi:hypothetical protein
MSTEAVNAAYKLIWHKDLNLPVESAGPPGRQPLDVAALTAAWQAAAQGVVKATRATWTDVADSIWHPHLTSFHAAIKNAWNELGEERVVTQILLIVREMHDDPLVAVVAYEQLQASLEIAGEAFLPKQVADLQKQYMDAHPTWREVRRRLSHESLRTRAEDYIPGGLREPADVLDASEELSDAFSA